MESNHANGSAVDDATPFERQRAALVAQVGQVMEQIITNMNQLNRNLESVLSVGKEFESVSTLWRSFHDVVGEDTTTQQQQQQQSQQNQSAGLDRSQGQRQ